MIMYLNNLEVISKLGDSPSIAVLSKGSKVRCISDDDEATRWGGNDSPKDCLTIGKVYTLARDPEVHTWHTKYYLAEIPGKRFNSVQFESAEGGDLL